ncbi:MAG: tRNA pseudouridine(38-40) synthase TruA [Spirochaetaceae bacterium]|jgi:tRNA pseudouridine38-40 synthase|nr:tRNA pseudouridine(38-40) synthase TruA [Spirochaetaceae bacterium]
MTERGERNIKLIIAYDGTDFSGWQRQDGARKTRTVQGVLEDALAKIHAHPVALTGSGRTDAGVHAAAQTANFHTGIARMDADRFVPALNRLLPRDVRVLSAEAAAPLFNARFDAKARTYRYFFIPGRPGLPPELRYAHQLWRRPRIGLLNDYARLFRGEMDCTLFASPADPSQSRHRHLFNACFFVERDLLVFEICANAFLWKMVRSIAGTLLYCADREMSAETLRDMIRAGSRSAAGPTLPPEGLFLWKVDYYADPVVPA